MFLTLTNRALATALVWMVLASSGQDRPWVTAEDTIMQVCTNEPVFVCGAVGQNTTMAYQSCGDGSVTLTVDWGSQPYPSRSSTAIGELPAGTWYNQTFVYEAAGTYFPTWQVEVAGANESIVTSLYNCKPPGDELFDESCQVERFLIEADSCMIQSPSDPLETNSTDAGTVDATISETSSSPVLLVSPRRWRELMVVFSVVARVVF
jgi:hypothetical protein